MDEHATAVHFVKNNIVTQAWENFVLVIILKQVIAVAVRYIMCMTDLNFKQETQNHTLCVASV